MNVSKEELELLLEIEKYLWIENKDISLYLRLHEFNEKLIQAREIRNERQKRYARSKKEKNLHKQAEERKNDKER